MRQELFQELKTKYPVLLEQISHFECDDGWYDIIDALCSTIANNGCSYNDDPLQVTQVKEKFAGLRFYVNYSEDKIDAAIEMAMKMSTRTCEVCGNRGHVVTSGYWIKTLCDTHRDEMGYREMEPKV
jgi:hypothetical protein